jgi:hypothetical protein
MSNSKLVEFIRFGSSIPGAYWGCCAADIIQCFRSDPDEKASIQLVDGDGASPLTFYNGSGNYQQAFAGPTNKDIFLSRLRIGTFGIEDMPNHAFFAIITEDQVQSSYGKKWLAILKETGFEFVRTVSNSVYEGQELADLSQLDEDEDGGSLNYIFMLVRNIGSGNVPDPYTPPQEWMDLPLTVPEAWTRLHDTVGLSKESHAAQTKIWNDIGPAKFLTEAEVVAAGAPVILAAKRTENPQEIKSDREKRKGTTVVKQPVFA